MKPAGAFAPPARDGAPAEVPKKKNFLQEIIEKDTAHFNMATRLLL